MADAHIEVSGGSNVPPGRPGAEAHIELTGTDSTGTVGPSQTKTATTTARASISVTSWEQAAPGVIQRQLEEVVELLVRSKMIEALRGDDRKCAEAFKTLLSDLITTETPPPKGPVREVLRWFGSKLEVFADETARAAGKATGNTLAYGGAALAGSYFPHLHETITALLGLSG